MEVDKSDIDFLVPTISLKFAGKQYDEVLIDGGSNVNILVKIVYREIGSPKLDAAPFQVKMADQSRLQPLGILQLKQEEKTLFANFPRLIHLGPPHIHS